MSPEIYCGIEPEERRLFRVNLPDSTASAITATVFNYFGVNLEERTGTNRKRECVKARQISMYIIRKKTRASLVSIGKYFKRDHSTVIYAIETTQDLMETDNNYKKEVDRLLNFLKDDKTEAQKMRRMRRFSTVMDK